jgi:hypothetical protein
MTAPTESMIEAIIGRQKLDATRTGADQCGNIIAELTALSLLIDKGIATVEEVTQRLRRIQQVLPLHGQAEDAKTRIEFLISVLQHVYGPKPRGWTPVVIPGGLSPGQADKTL